MKNYIFYMKFLLFLLFVFHKYIFYTNSFGKPIFNVTIFSDYNITFCYNPKLDPHMVPFGFEIVKNYLNMNLPTKFKKETGPFFIFIQENNLTFVVMIILDILIFVITLKNLFMSKSKIFPTIIFLYFLANLVTHIIKELLIDYTSDEDMSRVFIRFLNLFVPAYYSFSLKEFLTACFNIFFSSYFWRLSLSIVNFSLSLKILILNFLIEEDEIKKKDK